MMRNDVKLGLAVGGVLLAVLIVYVLVVPGGNEPGADLVTVDGAAPEAVAADDATGDVIPPDQLAVHPDGVTRPRANTAADPFATGRPGSPADGQRATAHGTAGGWDWARLLNGESAPTLMSETDVPTGEPPAGTAGEGTTPAATAGPAGPADTTVSILPDATQPPTLTPPPAVLPRNQLVVEPGATPTAEPTGGDPTPPAGAPRTHVVQPNETFSSIAQAAYGGARYYPHILRANPSVDPARLKPGMTIVIPPLTDVRPEGAAAVGGGARQASAAASRSASREPAPIDPRTEYRVEPNDSLYKIAVKLYGDGIRHAEIYELNTQLIGPDPARLKVGSVLKLPAPPTSQISAASR